MRHFAPFCLIGTDPSWADGLILLGSAMGEEQLRSDITMTLLIIWWIGELAASVHHAHNLDAGGCDPVENDVVWVGNDLA
jgi:hypothetical protein